MPQDAAHCSCFRSVKLKLQPDLNFNATLSRTGAFSQPIMLEDGGYVERRAANCLLSVLLHAALAALLLLLSFLSPVALRLQPWTRTILVMPLEPSKVERVAQPQAVTSAKIILSSLKLVSPVFSSKENRSEAVTSPPVLDISQSSAFALEDLSGNIVSSSLSAIAPLPGAERLRLLHLGGVVKNSHPLERLVLMYPELARAARVFGTVVIHAIINETGKVIDARAVSGPPMLYVTAVDAVSKERFVPMLLNGEPTKCDLMVQVSFTLNGGAD